MSELVRRLVITGDKRPAATYVFAVALLGAQCQVGPFVCGLLELPRALRGGSKAVPLPVFAPVSCSQGIDSAQVP